MLKDSLSPLERRRLGSLIGALFVTLVVGGLGVYAGTQIKSPAERQLKTEPPSLGYITAVVREGGLGGAVVSGFLLEPADPSLVIPAQSVTGIVTLVPKPGDPVRNGSVALEVEGRPIIALEGETILYRDLQGGTVGTDVLGFEQGLVNLGLDPGLVDGVYDAQTASAVEQLYQGVGYDPPLSLIEPDELADAEDARDEALEALAQAQASETANQRQLKKALDGAVRSLSVEQRQRDGLVSAADAQSQAASALVSKATVHLQSLQSAGASVEEIAAGELELEAAESAEQLAKAEADATRLEADAAVAMAEEALDQAEFELLNPPDQGLSGAQRAVRRSKDALAKLKLLALTPVAYTEIAFVAKLPSSVRLVTLAAGIDAAQGSVLLRNQEGMIAVLEVPRDVASQMSQGDAIRIRDGGNLNVEAKVSWIADSIEPGPFVSRHPEESRTIRPGFVAVEARASTVLNGDSISISADILGQSNQTSGLIVPISAIRTGSDGSAWVAVDEGNGSFQSVTVELGPSVGGEVLVVSTDLLAGDKLILGEL